MNRRLTYEMRPGVAVSMPDEDYWRAAIDHDDALQLLDIAARCDGLRVPEAQAQLRRAARLLMESRLTPDRK